MDDLNVKYMYNFEDAWNAVYLSANAGRMQHDVQHNTTLYATHY